MTTNTATWLDIIPALPLARGVPFLLCYEGADSEGDIHRVCIDASDDWVTWVDDEGDYTSTPECETRVDLDDPQGFGYALRHWYAAAAATADDAVLRWFELTLWAWTQGILDDSDSLALARALAEVVS